MFSEQTDYMVLVRY